MALLISLILALIPLLGIAYVLFSGLITTVDGLFLSLILAAMSGILLLNAGLELRKKKAGAASGGTSSGLAGARPVVGGTTQRGRVESVQFFEAHVGQPNRSIVTLSDGAKGSRLLVLEGDVRNALPVGQRVEFTVRKEGDLHVLAQVNYA